MTRLASYVHQELVDISISLIRFITVVIHSERQSELNIEVDAHGQHCIPTIEHMR